MRDIHVIYADSNSADCWFYTRTCSHSPPNVLHFTSYVHTCMYMHARVSIARMLGSWAYTYTRTHGIWASWARPGSGDHAYYGAHVSFGPRGIYVVWSSSIERLFFASRAMHLCIIISHSAEGLHYTSYNGEYAHGIGCRSVECGCYISQLMEGNVFR